jgi:dipicolinate synthase subunit A
MKYLRQKLIGNGFFADEIIDVFGEPAIFIESPGKKPDQLIELLIKLAPGSVLIGGQSGNELYEQAEKCGIKYINIMQDEAFAVQNAVPTAEGAVSLIISNTERVLRGMDIAITGFGRIGKVLSQMLYHLGANVHVFARNPIDRAWAMGFHVSDLCAIRDEIHSCGVLANTVPFRIIGKDTLDAMPKNSLLIELASYPYGFDAKLAEESGHRAIIAQALPAKMAPESAAEYMYEAVLRLVRNIA